MAQYQYAGVDRAGKKVAGSIDVQSEGDLRMHLRTQGIRPTKITKGVNIANADLGALLTGGLSATPKMNLEQLLGFTRQLQVLISAGIPVVQGLEILEEQQTDKGIKKILAGLREKVSGGMFLWEAAAQYPKAFPRMYVALIRAGESSGSIDQILGRLGRNLEGVDKLRKMVKSAMMYPGIVLCVGIGVIVLMLTLVIPKFEEMLKQANQELPAPTAFVLNMSHFVINNFLLLAGGTVTTLFLLVRFIRTKEGKAIFDRVMFRAPLFGGLIQKGGTARFCRTLATLLVSGVNLIDSIEICKATLDNAVFEEAIGKIRSEIEAGKQLGVVLTGLKAFPRMAVQMISVGEATGSMDKMLEKVASFYEEEVEMMVAGLTKLMEPLMLVFLGGAVGGLLISMYLPIFKMAGAG